MLISFSFAIVVQPISAVLSKIIEEHFIKLSLFCIHHANGFYSSLHMEKVNRIRKWGSLVGCLGVIFLFVFLLADSSEKTPLRFFPRLLLPLLSITYFPKNNICGKHYLWREREREFSRNMKINRVFKKVWLVGTKATFL